MGWRFLLTAIVCSSLSGCRSEPAPTGTGAREAVTKYFEALVNEDWDAAYAQVHADSRKRLDRAAFERQAKAYRGRLGFTPGKVFLRSCDEQGEKAIAQVILGDAGGSMRHRFHEGAILQQGADGWKVLLPDNFGHPK